MTHHLRAVSCGVLALVLSLGCGDTEKPSTSPTPSEDVLTLHDGLSGGDAHTTQDSGSKPNDTQGPSDTIETPEPYTRVTWRRLNRAEYNNTVRDLLGTSQTPADDFPADDLGYGFDNVASVLSLSPLHLEVYERAARKLAEEVTTPPFAEPQLILYEGEGPKLEATTGAAGGQGYNLWSNGQLYGSFPIPADGQYTIRARVWGQQAGPDPVKASFIIDDMNQEIIDITNTVDNPLVMEMQAELAEGNRIIGIEFHNDYYEPDEGLDRNLIIDWISVEGPTNPPDPAGSPYAKLFGLCDPVEQGQTECATAILEHLARRAWRGPVPSDQLSKLLALATIGWDEGESFESGLALPISAILLSPRFIFKTEFNDLPEDGAAEALTDYELATRLSYLMWSSMPDAELFKAAEEGLLQDPDELEKQARRMFANEKAVALRDNFAGQWLYIRDIDNIFPDTWVFPEFDEDLRVAMKEEMLRFFETFIYEDRSMVELLTAKDSVINHRLAEHYGIEGVTEEDGWTSVDLEGTPRKGLLTQAGILSVLSTPFRTSIVRRGKWVLEQLLCEAPPPPPPGVEGDLEQSEGEEAKTLREMMEQHVSDPACVSCHLLMDPIGFGLEHFDGIGQWRDTDNGFPVDPTGELPGGQTFENSDELIDLLSQDSRLAGCMVEKAFIYALGRGIKKEDTEALDTIEQQFTASDHRFEELLIQIVRSDGFRFRTGEPSEEAGP